MALCAHAKPENAESIKIRINLITSALGNSKITKKRAAPQQYSSFHHYDTKIILLNRTPNMNPEKEAQ